jgi:hypothetical protein
VRRGNRRGKSAHLRMLLLVRHVGIAGDVGAVEVANGVAAVHHIAGDIHRFLQLLFLFAIFGSAILKPDLRQDKGRNAPKIIF